MDITMKKIYIFSDTHSNISDAVDVLERADRVDAIIHAGDYVNDANNISILFPNIPMYSVRGNGDYFSRGSDNLTITIDGVKIFITHGHRYNVKSEFSLRTLKAAGRDAGAKLVVFGHTHSPIVDYDGDMTIVNPGSAGYNHQYAVVTIEDGKVKASTYKM